MLNGLFKIFSIILVALLFFVVIFAVLDYYRICEEIKQENWELTNKLRHCQKGLDEFESALNLCEEELQTLNR